MKKIKVQRLKKTQPSKTPRAQPKYVSAVSASGPAESRSSPLGKFVCALGDPFCEQSFGAKVPDEYTFPTEATTLRHRFVTTPGAGNVQYLVCTPHPQIGTLGLSTDGSTVSLGGVSGSTNTVQVNSVVGNILTVPFCTPVGPTTLQTIAGSYRVVGWGVRIKNITQATNVLGDILVAVLPTTGTAPTAFMNPLSSGTALVQNPGSSWRELANWCSLPTTSFSTTSGSYGVPVANNLDAMSSSETYTNAELAQTGGILIRPKIHAPGMAYKFRPTRAAVGPSASGVGSYSSSLTQGGAAGGTALVNFNPDVLDTSGHNCVVISLGSTAVVQTYEIEVIYHLETVPYVTSATGMVPTSFTSSPRVDPVHFMQRLNKVIDMPWFDFIKRQGTGMLENIQQALPGLMTRAAMMALA